NEVKTLVDLPKTRRHPGCGLMTDFTISETEGPALSYSRHLPQLEVGLEEPAPCITNAYADNPRCPLKRRGQEIFPAPFGFYGSNVLRRWRPPVATPASASRHLYHRAPRLRARLERAA